MGDVEGETYGDQPDPLKLNTDSLFGDSGSTDYLDSFTYLEQYFPNIDFEGSMSPGTKIDNDGNLFDPSNNLILNLNTYSGPQPLTFENGKLVINNGGFEGTTGITGTGDTVNAENVGTFSRTDPLFSISNAKNMEYSSNKIIIEHADTIDLLDNTLQNVFYFEYDLGDNIKVDEADDVFTDSIHFKNIKNSSFIIKGDLLISAKIQARQNETYELWNPINDSFRNIMITAEKDCRFELDFRAKDSNGKQQFVINAEKCISVSLYTTNDSKLTFNGLTDDSSLILTEGIPPTYEIKQGNLTFSTNKFQENFNGFVIASINETIGSQELVLKPYLVLQPGGRYTYEDLVNKELSFSLFNQGSMDFYLGLNKAGEKKYADYKQGKERNFGFIDFPGAFKELNGIITYEKYGSVPLTQNIQQLQFLNIYTKNDLNNKANFMEQNNSLSLQLANGNPLGDSLGIINYGTTEIDEQKDKRLLRINQLPATYYLQLHKYDFRKDIIFNDKTAVSGNIVIYNLVNSLMEKSAALDSFEREFSSKLSLIHEKYRSFHVFLTQERRQ